MSPGPFDPSTFIYCTVGTGLCSAAANSGKLLFHCYYVQGVRFGLKMVLYLLLYYNTSRQIRIFPKIASLNCINVIMKDSQRIHQSSLLGHLNDKLFLQNANIIYVDIQTHIYHN